MIETDEDDKLEFITPRCVKQTSWQYPQTANHEQPVSDWCDD